LTSKTITIQLHDKGRWHDACEVILHDPERGHQSGSTIEYFENHSDEVLGFLMQEGMVQKRCVSVSYPVGSERQTNKHWPSFLLDMLPQGENRRIVSGHLGVNRDHKSTDFALLMACGGNPVGNLRIKEAVVDADLGNAFGLPLAEIISRSDRFLELYQHPGSISSLALQGEWAKIALTEARDGLFYPDGTVPDNHALGHFIAKFAIPGDRDRPEYLLDGEYAYAQIAEHLNLGAPPSMLQGEHILLTKRFDRDFGLDGKVERHGLESLVSAIGISEFGHVGHHERYIEIIRELDSWDADSVSTYILRDLANLALGNPDNHGRNSALLKRSRGGTVLAPFFDFAPMHLSNRGIRRSTRWECMKESGGDSSLDWAAVLAYLDEQDYNTPYFVSEMKALAVRLSDANIIARTRGMSRERTDRAMTRLPQVIAAIDKL
jgi:serine/threonine-protein kinase HipA